MRGVWYLVLVWYGCAERVWVTCGVCVVSVVYGRCYECCTQYVCGMWCARVVGQCGVCVLHGSLLPKVQILVLQEPCDVANSAPLLRFGDIFRDVKPIPRSTHTSNQKRPLHTAPSVLPGPASCWPHGPWETASVLCLL